MSSNILNTLSPSILGCDNFSIWASCESLFSAFSLALSWIMWHFSGESIQGPIRAGLKTSGNSLDLGQNLVPPGFPAPLSTD